jgi:hypothetical protein
MTETFAPDLPPASRAERADKLADEFESLVTDYGLATGALAVIPNTLLQAVGQRMFEARPLLAALFELGHRHTDELVAIVDRNRGGELPRVRLPDDEP